MKRGILAAATAIACSAAFAGQAFEDLAVGDIVEPGTTIAGQRIEMAEGDVWVKSASALLSGDLRLVNMTESGQRPGFAYMHLMKGDKVIARRVLSTVEPQMAEGQHVPTSCTFGELDVMRYGVLTDALDCGGVRMVPTGSGYEYMFERLNASNKRFTREVMYVHVPKTDEIQAKNFAAESTIWLMNPGFKQVTPWLSKAGASTQVFGEFAKASQ